MIQKKVCMVGVHGTGKTSLVQRFVYSLFSAKYHSTVGVKIDRKSVDVSGTQVNLLLWDIEGRTSEQEVPSSYLKGSHGILYVVDGTRRETFDQLFELHTMACRIVGDVPSVVALNKIDLTDQWLLSRADDQKLAATGLHAARTSAKSGEGVEGAFQWMAEATLRGGATRR